MNKYSGIHTVEVSVSKNDCIKSKRKQSGFSGLILRTLISAAIFGVLATMNVLGGRFSLFAAKVKEAICFDAPSYIAELIEEKSA